ncbi:unnamed protein product, partial [Pelagomonas calceolata]
MALEFRCEDAVDIVRLGVGRRVGRRRIPKCLAPREAQPRPRARAVVQRRRCSIFLQRAVAPLVNLLRGDAAAALLDHHVLEDNRRLRIDSEAAELDRGPPRVERGPLVHDDTDFGVFHHGIVEQARPGDGQGDARLVREDAPPALDGRVGGHADAGRRIDAVEAHAFRMNFDALDRGQGVVARQGQRPLDDELFLVAAGRDEDERARRVAHRGPQRRRVARHEQRRYPLLGSPKYRRSRLAHAFRVGNASLKIAAAQPRPRAPQQRLLRRRLGRIVHCQGGVAGLLRLRGPPYPQKRLREVRVQRRRVAAVREAARPDFDGVFIFSLLEFVFRCLPLGRVIRAAVSLWCGSLLSSSGLCSHRGPLFVVTTRGTHEMIILSPLRPIFVIPMGLRAAVGEKWTYE